MADLPPFGAYNQADCRVQYQCISKFLVNIEFAQSGRGLFSYLNTIVDNLKQYTSNTDNTCNDKNKGSECALNEDDVIILTARFL